jgi:hypothetical protein
MSRTTGDSPAPVSSSVSIVCVYNDPAVRRECLGRSIRASGRHAPGVEYLPVDNVDGRYRSAGAALNHGAWMARNDVVVFVHQDVFLHSLAAVTRAAGQLRPGGLGVLGAVGVRGDGRIAGRVRDRAVLLGAPVQQPVDVDSVDELLFMVPRPLVLRHPLTESPDMAWHAYAVEYGLRVRRLGLRVGVTDIPLTHNSLTTNLARLDVAHAPRPDHMRGNRQQDGQERVRRLARVPALALLMAARIAHRAQSPPDYRSADRTRRHPPRRRQRHRARAGPSASHRQLLRPGAVHGCRRGPAGTDAA